MLPSLADQIAADLLALRSANRLRTCPTLSGASRVNITLEGQPLVSFCSNDYLGLTCDPRLGTAAAQAASASGFGAGASRLVSGNYAEHIALENSLAAYLSLPAALLFPTGYQANLAVVTALAGPDDLIVADRAIHASLLDGCRLSRAKLAVYPHLKAEVAERHLARLGPGRRRRLLITESLFSMDGDVAPLPHLAAIATSHDAALIVDEAHAFGSLGPSGRGLCAQFGVQPDALIGTLGKAIGASGAFVAGTTQLRDFLLNRARSFIFTTALPIPVAAAALAALKVISSTEGDHLRSRLASLTAQLRQLLGLPIPSIPSPILPLTIGEDHATVEAALYLRSRGFFVQPIRPPTVPQGKARLRITLTSQHAEQQVTDLANAIASLPAPRPSSMPLHPEPSHNNQTSISNTAQQAATHLGRGLFLLGTDTGVGKTSVAVALLHILLKRGAKPVPFKPVETGVRPLPSDALRLLSASQRPDIPLNIVCPITFPDPVAPAAASTASPLTLPDLLTHARKACSYGSHLIVESAGGILSPYASQLTSLDLACAYGLPVLLVARNGLGTISHTALAIQEIQRRSVIFLGTILVTNTANPTPDQETNSSLIAAATGQKPLGTLPFLATHDPADIATALASSVDLSAILEPLFS